MGAHRYQSTAHGAERVDTRREFPHPQYGANENDIMIVQLSRMVTRKTIKLNKNSRYPSEGKNLKVIGLGATGEDRGSPNTLRKVTVDYVSNQKCKKKYPRGWINKYNMICASRRGRDSCYGTSTVLVAFFHGFVGFYRASRNSLSLLTNLVFSLPISTGDSGGPLFDDRDRQVGVVSW